MGNQREIIRRFLYENQAGDDFAVEKNCGHQQWNSQQKGDG